MKILLLVMTYLLLSNGTVHAESASETANEYYNLLKQKNYDRAATILDPSAINQFRQMLTFIMDLPEEKQNEAYSTIFGPSVSKESIIKMSNLQFFTSFLRFIMSNVESVGVTLDKTEILGEIKEGNDIAHVVTRSKFSTSEYSMEAMEVVSFKRNGKEWKALLSGEIKGFPNQLKRSLLAQPEAKILKSLPNLSDYGTDIQSIGTYDDAINSTPIKLCEDAYKNKSGDGAYCLAKKAKSSEDAIRYYKEAASFGHPAAKNDLALLYANLHLPELLPEIKKLMISAAQSGIPHAQVSLGWCYMTGEHGFSKDYSEAMQWSLKGYKQGHSEGANNIGELYEKGLGVPKNLEIAKSWYKKASVLGNKEATERLEQATK